MMRIEELPIFEDSQSGKLLKNLANYQDLHLSMKDEYFLAIAKCKDNKHSFLMLGVVHEDTPVILTRVGKTPLVDKPTDVFSQMKLCYHAHSGDGLPAMIQFEFFGRNTKKRAISYQAYSITYKQLMEFLHLLYDIEQDALKDDWKKSKIDSHKSPVLKSYFPLECHDDQLKFRWLDLRECSFKNSHEKDFSQVMNDAQTIQMLNNDCRKTIVDILDAILGVPTEDIPKSCFASFAYETTWSFPGKLDQETCYIWPLPPPKEGSEESKKFKPDQLRTLHKLYARLKEVPKLNSRSKETRDKFNALKEMYIEIAGEENLETLALLNRINEYENKNNNLEVLYQNRGLFSFTTTTKRMMDNIKSDLVHKSTIAVG